MEEQIKWMTDWCASRGLKLELAGEVGFGRECVGVLSPCGKAYPDYYWRDEEYNRVDNNGEVWTPDNAYHKHDCVAVLGRGENAVAQLFEWLKWFDANGFFYECSPVACSSQIELMMGRDKHHKMVKR